jgi:xanthine/CO dehydrogenase XdhC/CoxF family maturation factor
LFHRPIRGTGNHCHGLGRRGEALTPSGAYRRLVDLARLPVIPLSASLPTRIPAVAVHIEKISPFAALRQVVYSPVRYIGMIGSRHKCETILNHLRADGIGEDVLKRVYAPIGLDLGGPMPEEIAVSILAEVIAVRRGVLMKVTQGSDICP